jgi:hypothetical protein
MDGRSPRLSRYYGSIVEDPLPVSDVDEAFTDFVLENRDDIVEEARQTRPIYRVWFEFIDKDDDWARLRVGSGRELVDLGTAHPHGEWIDLDFSVL